MFNEKARRIKQLENRMHGLDIFYTDILRARAAKNERYLKYLKFLVMKPPKKGDPPIDVAAITLTEEEKQELIDTIDL